ncbi:MAG: hypothetical protein WD795_15495 [Woeseia sp.]
MDLGRHTRLAFGLPDGGFVEYGYGEWQWYKEWLRELGYEVSGSGIFAEWKYEE